MKNQQKTELNFFSKYRVAVPSISFGKSSILREELQQFFPNSFFNDRGVRFSETELIEFLKGADAAIIGIEPVTDQVISKIGQLKIISKYGVGLDSIDQVSLKKKNIALGWTGGVNRRSVSELTLCFMLGLCRNVFTSGYSLKKSKWEKEGGWQLSGKTIGIIGCGYVGSDVIKLLTPLECKILVCDIVDKSEFCMEHNATQTDLANLTAKSDIISIHVPLTSLTSKMVNKKFINQMQTSAYLINTSRGEVLNQNDLKNALIMNEIAGAALDVFAEEPPSDDDFLLLPNLMVSPHIGGNAKEAVEAMGKSAINHLVSFFKNHSKENRK